MVEKGIEIGEKMRPGTWRLARRRMSMGATASCCHNQRPVSGRSAGQKATSSQLDTGFDHMKKSQLPMVMQPCGQHQHPPIIPEHHQSTVDSQRHSSWEQISKRRAETEQGEGG